MHFHFWGNSHIQVWGILHSALTTVIHQKLQGCVLAIRKSGGLFATEFTIACIPLLAWYYTSAYLNNWVQPASVLSSHILVFPSPFLLHQKANYFLLSVLEDFSDFSVFAPSFFLLSSFPTSFFSSDFFSSFLTSVLSGFCSGFFSTFFGSGSSGWGF